MVGNISLSLTDLEKFEIDSKWFYKNIDLLREKNFTGKFVAIKNREVIASDNNVNNIVKSVEASGVNPSYIVIEFIYPKEAVVLF